jgi:hypothetical protein
MRRKESAMAPISSSERAVSSWYTSPWLMRCATTDISTSGFEKRREITAAMATMPAAVKRPRKMNCRSSAAADCVASSWSCRATATRRCPA